MGIVISILMPAAALLAYFFYSGQFGALFHFADFVILFGPLSVLLVFQYVFRRDLRPFQQLGVSATVYCVATLTFIGLNTFAVPLSRWGHPWLGIILISIVVPALSCSLLGIYLRARRMVAPPPLAGEQLNQDRLAPGHLNGHSQLGSINPIVLVAIIQAVATILAALISKLF